VLRLTECSSYYCLLYAQRNGTSEGKNCHSNRLDPTRWKHNLAFINPCIKTLKTVPCQRRACVRAKTLRNALQDTLLLSTPLWANIRTYIVQGNWPFKSLTVSHFAVWEIWEYYTKFQSVNLKGRDYLKNIQMLL
jgi:hypothetical protein